jgi:hypothetical protein
VLNRELFIAEGYQRKKDANKGYNFRITNENGKNSETNGYLMYKGFSPRWHVDATTSLLEAAKIVTELRSEGNYAELCGYVKTVQRVKHYTIISKNKTTYI